ncbi:MAG: ATP-binding protein [Bacteroidota bacterium]
MRDSTDYIVDVSRIQNILKAKVWVENSSDNEYITGIYASDLMSDVLAYGKAGSMLLTGLNTVQAVISAYMAEFRGVTFIRNKNPEEETLKFAREKGMFVLSTKSDMYEACVKLATLEIEVSKEVIEAEEGSKAENIATHTFFIDGNDFANAGMVSTQVKALLKSLGYDPGIIRRAAISTYEAEMNVVMHARKADVTLTASDKEIYIIFCDEGKGIKDIGLAMQEGYSTATEEQRALGFGAGMGLPNIKKNADELEINSVVDVGTRIEIIFHIK